MLYNNGTLKVVKNGSRYRKMFGNPIEKSHTNALECTERGIKVPKVEQKNTAVAENYERRDENGRIYPDNGQSYP